MTSTKQGVGMLAGASPPDRGACERLITDSELWYRIAANDHAAFTELFERHAKAVWNHAYRVTASWDLAEDLLATTFLTAWQRRATAVLVRDSALPWLFTVTANLANNERRRRTRFLRILPRLVASDRTRDHADELSERDQGRARLATVLAAVDRLPAAEREATRLCLIGKVSTADAATLLGITEASVRSRLSRARARLRRTTEEASDD